MTWQLHHGAALDVLRSLPEASVQCCVTSPPYWGLRDYGTGRWEGGDPACAHAGVAKPRQDTSGSTKRFSDTRGMQPSKGAYSVPVRDVCRCGARRVDEQIGLEPTPYAFVDALVEVFREVRRVLAPDGVLWLNLGDCYATGAGAVGNCPGVGKQGARWRGDVERVRDEKRGYRGGHQATDEHMGKLSYRASVEPQTQPNRMPIKGLKTKDLVGVPWRVAFALQADGWYLRSDVIWHKPNPMPESVKDRPTKAHEYVFLLTKSERYAYDADAISEPASDAMRVQVDQGYSGIGTKAYESNGVQNPSSVKARIIENARQRGSVAQHKQVELGQNSGGYLGTNEYFLTRNARSVWSITTEPSPFDHFAVMPKALARRCILAGCAPGATVLDPFAGMATTGVVAIEEGRSFIGIELNPKYHEAARCRMAETMPLLATEVAS